MEIEEVTDNGQIEHFPTPRFFVNNCNNKNDNETKNFLTNSPKISWRGNVFLCKYKNEIKLGNAMKSSQ